MLKGLVQFSKPQPLEIERGRLEGEDFFGCSKEQIQQAWLRIVLYQDVNYSDGKFTTNMIISKQSISTKEASFTPTSNSTMPQTIQEQQNYIRCPYCKEKYRLSWPSSPKEYCCPNKSCRRWFRIVLATAPFRCDLVFLDIETTGLISTRDLVTTIVWWSAEEGWGHWIQGVTEKTVLKRIWRNTRRIATFNGKSFDEHFIMEHFNVQKHKNHIDLKILATKHGEKGGLKQICERLGMSRPSYLNRTNGRGPIKLWQDYKMHQDASALKRLLHYNAWDVVMTYRLHQFLEGESIQPIENTMPFEWT